MSQAEQTSPIGQKIPRPRLPAVMLGPMSEADLHEVEMILPPGSTLLGGYLANVTSATENRGAPVHEFIVHYVDSEGHSHILIGVEDPNNGHSAVLADVIVAA